MTSVRARGEQARKFILEELENHPKDIVRFTMLKFDITRQAVNRHLNNLIKEGAVLCAGVTSARVYRLAPLVEWHRTYPIGAPLVELSEDIIWREVANELGQIPANVRGIWAYGFTEMFNNVIDHSGARSVLVRLRKTAASTEIVIYDDGVGIFRKIQAALGLIDERHAVLELAKGKFTTDPERHTGEGIFFSSRSFDAFQIMSGGVYFSHDFGDAEDWILETKDPAALNGTWVRMRLHNHTARRLNAIFEQYTTGEEGEPRAFTKTVVPVRLAQYGDESLVSRSQAKRLLARVDRFRTVILDFTGVESIGQSFSDEIFRVFHRQHPEIDLIESHANSQVAAMIGRARAVSAQPTPSTPTDLPQK